MSNTLVPDAAPSQSRYDALKVGSMLCLSSPNKRAELSPSGSLILQLPNCSAAATLSVHFVVNESKHHNDLLHQSQLSTLAQYCTVYIVSGRGHSETR